MTINHHIETSMLMQYAAGELDYATSLLIATHISLCDQCRSEIEMVDILGGTVLDEAEAIAPSSSLEDSILASIQSTTPQARPASSDVYPQPLVEAMGSNTPKWSSIAPGIKQSIIATDQKSSVRLLWIDAGKPVPEHSHKGDELTLVLQGAFADEAGIFRKGDVEIADGDVQHQPIALEGEPCICLAATSDQLIFKSILPRMMQPIFRI